MSTSEEEQALCELCGEPMPAGEEMFKYHGFSGPCPKPPKPQEETWHDLEYARKFCYEHLPIPYLQMPEFIEQCSRLVILYAEKVSDDRRTRESGGAMSADSVKPDAGEWARQLVQNNPSDLEGWAELEQSDIEERLDAFQRETMLWLIGMFYDDDDGVEYCACCHRLKRSHSAQCRVAELERLAESCGRK